MATQGSINFTDYQDTPVAHAVDANGIERINGTEVAHYRTNEAALPLDGQITAKYTRKSLPSGVKVLSAEMSIPVLENVTGGTSAGYTAPPKVAYVDRIVITQYVHPRSTITGRRSVRRFATTVLSGLNVAGQTITLDTEPANLFDKVIFPS